MFWLLLHRLKQLVGRQDVEDWLTPRRATAIEVGLIWLGFLIATWVLVSR